MLALAVVAILGLLVQSAHIYEYVVHESRHQAKSIWQKTTRASSSSIMPLRIGIAQQNLVHGPEHLMAVSSPESSTYGQYWTQEQVVKHFAPSEEDLEMVRNWLIESGMTRKRIVHSNNKGWLALDATVAEVESLLKTEVYTFVHTETGARAFSSNEYSVPKHIQSSLDYITPGIRLPFSQSKSRITVGEPRAFSERSKIATFPHYHCSMMLEPLCVRELYNISKAPSHPGSSKSMGLYEDGNYYSQSDYDLFYKHYTQGSIPNGIKPIDKSIDGGHAQAGDYLGEEVLDYTVAIPLLYPQNITISQVDDLHYGNVKHRYNTTYPDGFSNFLDALDGSYCTYSAYGETGNNPMIDPTFPDPAPNGYKGELQCGIFQPTNVISISNAGQEADLPAFYEKRQCNEFLKLGLQGVSIFLPSGDTGVAPYPPADGPTGCLSPKADRFSPMWPSNCPLVTVVGGTQINPNSTVQEPEAVASKLFSPGGGFSNLYPAPSYQTDAIKSYFAKHDPSIKSYSHIFNLTKVISTYNTSGVYNRISRGIPDVAATGGLYVVVYYGMQSANGGTSASTPVFAAIVNRINEARLAAGKSTVGFINPVLYKHPEVLHDITQGSIKGCNNTGTAFHAVPGWDPASGLGTPDLGKMLDLFMSL